MYPNRAFSFQNPIACGTLYLGGKLIQAWIWSGMALYYFNITLQAQLSKNLSSPPPKLAVYRLSSVFGYPRRYGTCSPILRMISSFSISLHFPFRPTPWVFREGHNITADRQSLLYSHPALRAYLLWFLLDMLNRIVLHMSAKRSLANQYTEW